MQPPPEPVTPPPSPVREPARPPRERGGGALTRYVLPVALFVAVVGAVAWVAQYMPSWRDPAQNSAPPPAAAGPPAVQFVRTRAVWDKDDPDYVRETERNVSGRYDFPFRNTGDQPAELGLQSKSCDCTEVQICLLPAEAWTAVDAALKENPSAEPALGASPAWQPLPPDEMKGVRLEPGQGGLLRVTWNNRRATGDRLNLKQRVWVQPAGRVMARQVYDIEVPVIAAPMVYFTPDNHYVGVLGARDVGRATFEVWSGTRDKIDLKVQEKTADPLLVVRQRELTGPEREELQKRLREQGKVSRVKTAYEVNVTAHEQKDGKEMDQGPFARKLPLLVDGEPLEGNVGPTVSGYVKSDVQVGVPEDRGQVQLNAFAAADGTRKRIALFADPKVTLEPVSQEPSYLQVKLTKNETNAQRTRWQLEVTVPPNAAFGPLPEDAAVVLRIAGDNPRLVRIPVVGTGATGQ